MAADDLEDVEVATKAPESDAQEDADKTNAQETKPTLGEHCVSDRPAPTGAEPKGEITTLNGVDTYVSKPQFYPSQPAKLLLLLSPGTGLHSVNNQLQADQWAEEGYVVIMPDQFGGDPVEKMDTTGDGRPQLADASGDVASTTAPPNTAEGDGTEPGASTQTTQQEQNPTEKTVSSWVDRIKQTVLDTAKSFRIDMWLARHTPATVLPRLVAVLDAASDDYADALAYGDGVYGVGYCFGGRYALLLLGEIPADVLAGQRDVGAAPAVQGGTSAGETVATTTDEGKAAEGVEESEGLNTEAGMKRHGRKLKAAVIAHGTGIGREDFVALDHGAGRLGVVAVSDDPLFTDDVREYGIKRAGDKGVLVQERVWEGVPHGFAVVGEYEDHKIAQAQKEAHHFMVDFLKQT